MKAKDFIKLLDTATENTEISIENGEIVITESKPKDITERIKTFEDAYQWCEENGDANLVNHYDDWEIYNDTSKDIIAYLKLRIITAALNEGWEPTFEKGEYRWFTAYGRESNMAISDYEDASYSNRTPAVLFFKSEALAKYAANQFIDLYVDFCGRKKGGEG